MATQVTIISVTAYIINEGLYATMVSTAIDGLECEKEKENNVWKLTHQTEISINVLVIELRQTTQVIYSLYPQYQQEQQEKLKFL